jgi:hypothetical protein
MAFKPVSATGPAGPVSISYDKAGNVKIEAPTAAEASEAFQKTRYKEGPFSEDDIEEITHFIEDPNLKSIMERDLLEINTCFNNGANKSILLLCGSIIEVFLYQSLSKKEPEAKKYFDDLKRVKDPEIVGLEIDKWFLGDMLTVSEHLNLVDSHFSGKARLITDYRNIIHPTYEVREKVGQIENLAPISLELIKMLIKQIKERQAC